MGFGFDLTSVIDLIYLNESRINFKINTDNLLPYDRLNDSSNPSRPLKIV